MLSEHLSPGPAGALRCWLLVADLLADSRLWLCPQAMPLSLDGSQKSCFHPLCATGELAHIGKSFHPSEPISSSEIDSACVVRVQGMGVHKMLCEQ